MLLTLSSVSINSCYQLFCDKDNAENRRRRYDAAVAAEAEQNAQAVARPDAEPEAEIGAEAANENVDREDANVNVDREDANVDEAAGPEVAGPDAAVDDNAAVAVRPRVRQQRQQQAHEMVRRSQSNNRTRFEVL